LKNGRYFFIFAPYLVRAKSKKISERENYFVGVQASVKLKNGWSRIGYRLH